MLVNVGQWYQRRMVFECALIIMVNIMINGYVDQQRNWLGGVGVGQHGCACMFDVVNGGGGHGVGEGLGVA